MSEEKIDCTFAELAAEPALYGVHLAGGEATGDMERLEYALHSAKRHGVGIDYLETNCHWCDSEKAADEGFTRLRDAGLRSVLVSASLFHNEFIPLKRTLFGIKSAKNIFNGNVIVWTAEVLRLMQARLDPEKTHTLAESCRLTGIDPESGEIWRLHNYLTPGGRAAEVLGKGLKRYPVEHFADDDCRSELESTGHFHIHPGGELSTGHCPGISPATVGELHPQITSERLPLYAALCEHGPATLPDFAPDFRPRPDGYIGKCDLCLDVRKHLFKTGKYEELRPAEFYG
jgi:hypothetical protein